MEPTGRRLFGSGEATDFISSYATVDFREDFAESHTAGLFAARLYEIQNPGNKIFHLSPPDLNRYLETHEPTRRMSPLLRRKVAAVLELYLEKPPAKMNPVDALFAAWGKS